jgi:hypothetical protein
VSAAADVLTATMPAKDIRNKWWAASFDAKFIRAVRTIASALCVLWLLR